MRFDPHPQKCIENFGQTFRLGNECGKDGALNMIVMGVRKIGQQNDWPLNFEDLSPGACEDKEILVSFVHKASNSLLVLQDDKLVPHVVSGERGDSQMLQKPPQSLFILRYLKSAWSAGEVGAVVGAVGAVGLLVGRAIIVTEAAIAAAAAGGAGAAGAAEATGATALPALSMDLAVMIMEMIEPVWVGTVVDILAWENAVLIALGAIAA